MIKIFNYIKGKISYHLEVIKYPESDHVWVRVPRVRVRLGLIFHNEFYSGLCCSVCGYKIIPVNICDKPIWVDSVTYSNSSFNFKSCAEIQMDQALS